MALYSLLASMTTLERKQNPRSGSNPGCEKVVDMINKTRVLRDVRKLSPGQQTSNVEAFHSLIIRFAPKSVHFSFLGMLTRLCLAAMHYNENAGRKQAKNRDGELVFIIRYPKFKNGGYTLQAKKVHPTFEYVDDLMNTLFQKTLVDPTHLWEEWKDVQARVPATLNAGPLCMGDPLPSTVLCILNYLIPKSPRRRRGRNPCRKKRPASLTTALPPRSKPCSAPTREEMEERRRALLAETDLILEVKPWLLLEMAKRLKELSPRKEESQPDEE
ncbi:uncharacterized protein KZ484_003309 [Pholidichthys leucotaenia]